MIIDDNFLSDESKQFIENYVLSRHFPLYMQKESVKGDETPFLNEYMAAPLLIRIFWGSVFFDKETNAAVPLKIPS